MALEPSDIVNDVAKRAHDREKIEPPRMLRHPPGAGAALPPLQPDEVIAEVHRSWARIHEGEAPGQEAGRGALGAARARLAAAAASAARPTLEADRALIGDLIRAVDALAARVDEIGRRLVALEELVEEVVVVTGEDLTAVRAALEEGRPADA